MTSVPTSVSVFPKTTWSEQYSVGIVRLDDQHRKIFQMLNNLRQAMLEKKSNQVLRDIINELAQYAKTHFTSEEAYFQMYNYPEKDEHKREHEEFVKKVRQFQADLEAGRAMVTMSVFTFLAEWVRNHVLVSDKKYGPFLREKGVR